MADLKWLKRRRYYTTRIGSSGLLLKEKPCPNQQDCRNSDTIEDDRLRDAPPAAT